MSVKVVLEYFADKYLQSPIPVNEEGQPIFDWGETIPGERKEKTFYIKNNTHDTITLRQPHTTDEDFKIKDYPTQLKGQDTSTITLEFSPRWDRTKPLDAGFDFDKIIG
jgi:hypothetical protein